MPGANNVKVSGATLNVGTTCSVFVQVTSTKFLNLTNTIPIGAVTSTEGLTNSLATSATLSTLQGLGITKAFTPTSVSLGQVSQLAVRLISTLDPGAPVPVTLTNVSYSDTLPGTLTIAPTPNASTTCTNGSVTAAPGSGVVTVTGVTLPPGANCYMYVDVLTSALGAFINTIPAGGVTTGEGYSNQAAAQATLNVLPPPTVTKSFAPASVAPGVAAQATILIHNNSATITLHNVAYVDTLPGGLAVAPTPNATVSCGAGAAVAAAASGSTITLTNGTIPPNGDCTVQVDVRSNTPGSYTNTIAAGSITTAEGISNPTDSSGTLDVLGPPNVVKAFVPASINAGEISRLTIQLGNPNPSAATLSANFTDTLPANVVLAAVPNLGGTCTLASVTAPGGGTAITYASGASLPSGGCTIAVDVTSSVAGSYTNNIPAGALQTSIGNNGSAASAGLVVISSADLAVTKVVDNATPIVGNNVVFTITVTNLGPSAAVNVVANDLLPSGYAFVGATPSAGSYDAPSGVWSGIGTLANGASATLAITAKVLASGTYLNTVTTTSDTPDPVPGNNSASAGTTPVSSADVAITKLVSNGAPNVGTDVTFTLTVVNNGPSPAVNVLVNDLLPPGYSFVSATPSIGTYDGNTGVWSGIGTLASGASATLAITATVQAAGAYLNTGTVTSDTPDPNPGNNSSSAGTSPVAVAHLALAKTDNSATYTPGGSGTYVIVVTNGGPSAANAVTLADALPAGVTLNGTVTCSPAGAATCGSVFGVAGQASLGATGATIAAGAGNSLTFTAPVKYASSLAANPLVNTASASDPASATATGSDSSARAPSVSLAVVKTDGSATYTPGGSATYLVTVTNTGPSDAASVSVTDTLPAGVTLTAGATCAPSGAATCGTVTGSNGQARVRHDGRDARRGRRAIRSCSRCRWPSRPA